MTRPVLAEVGRYTRALAAPALVVAAILSARHVLDGPPIADPPLSEAAAAGWVGALAAAVAWLILVVVVAALQPGGDRRASERLQTLRDRSHAPRHMLVAIQHVAWIGAAGQRVHALDVGHGTLHDLWLSELALPVGSFAVLDLTADPIRVIDWLDHAAMVRARRHDAQETSRRRSETAHIQRAAARRQKTATAELVEEAERLLRRK